MSNFNFSPRTIAALVMGLGVSFYATAGIGKLKIISADAQRFEAEIPIVDEPVPDSASVRLANSAQYGLSPNSDQASQLSFARQGDRILVDGPMPVQGGEPLRFALEVSWPEGSLVREFQVQPLVPAVVEPEAEQPAAEGKTAKKSVPQKKKTEAADGSNAIQPDDAKLDTLKLGDLKVVSALGQPLSVEVDVYGNAVRQNSKNIKVQVFPDVSIAGSDPDLMQTLSTLQYRIEKRPSGKHVLKLRSNKAVSEPILPLQIEAVSGNERSVRQYTVLLDPAGYQVAKQGNTHSGNTVDAESPRRSRGAAATNRHSDRSVKPLKVYRVLKGDSLSEIAGKMRGREGLAERMQQLKDANPDAFIRGDINQLRAGATLHYPAHWKLSASHNVVRQSPSIDSGEAMAAPESTAAERPARSSTRSTRQGTPRAVAPKPIERATPAPETKSAVAPVTKPAASPKTTAPSSQATTTPATVKSTAPAPTKPAASVAKPAPSAPAAVTAKPAPATKPAVPAAAQPKPAPAPLAASAAQPMPKSVEAPAPATVTPVTTASATTAQVASAPIQATASAALGETPEKLARVQELRARLAEQDAQLKKADDTAIALQAELAKLNPGTAPAAESKPEQEEESLFALAGDYRLIAGGVVGLMVISGGWYALRRRRKKQSSYESLEGLTGEVSGLALTTLMSANQPGSVDFDMTDPLVEAENLLHEGSTDKALDILREGLTREPMRQDVRLRLLEILARNNEQHAFVEEALVAKTLFGVNSPLWQRTTELAHTLDPVPDLFAGSAVGKAGDQGSQREDKGAASPSAPAGV